MPWLVDWSRETGIEGKVYTRREILFIDIASYMQQREVLYLTAQSKESGGKGRF